MGPVYQDGAIRRLPGGGLFEKPGGSHHAAVSRGITTHAAGRVVGCAGWNRDHLHATGLCSRCSPRRRWHSCP
jgi:hypothetical protein